VCRFGFQVCAPQTHCYCTLPFPVFNLFCIIYGCAPDDV